MIKRAKVVTMIILLCIWISFTAAKVISAEIGESDSIQSLNKAEFFAEVEIVLNDQFTLARLCKLPQPPGASLKISDDTNQITMQLSADQVKLLTDAGANVTVLRSFALLTSSENEANDSDGILNVSPMGTAYISAVNNSNFTIPTDKNWVGSVIQIQAAPSDAEVTSIDVHYEIEPSITGFLYSEISDNDPYFTHQLVDGENEPVNQTKTGIETFNGRDVNQNWFLWAREEYSYGGGYIDSWWIKIYYDDGGSSDDYCSAWGGGSDYIKDVQVGTINNTATASDGYADYTSLSTTMKTAIGYPITVVNGNSWLFEEKCGIWVDWNQDDDFDDADEEILVSGGPKTFTATITPPEDAALGDTRMRVRIINSGTPEPCGDTLQGEVEDYTINVAQGGYCSASGGCEEHISRVQVGTIDNSSNCEEYSDYTAQSTDMQIGQGYDITVTNGDPYEGDDLCGIWVDWNQDQDFDDTDEAISVSGNPGDGPYTASITPPANASLGQTRMRVRIVYDETPNPCDDTGFGEVEDYTINVTSAGYCAASGGGREYIKFVHVTNGSILNYNTGSDGYADYSAMSEKMNIGQSYSIDVGESSYYPGDQCGIWVDWNQDNDFDDPGEEIAVGGNPTIFKATITPPVGAVLGNTRLRIRLQNGGELSPCGDTDFGEVEDYTIQVSDDAPEFITISGYIFNGNEAAVEGIQVSANTGQSDVTDPNGYYEIQLPNPWQGTIRPSKTNWKFEPEMYGFVSLNQDRPDQNFTIYWPYSGGTGTDISPYLIATPNDLNAIGAQPQHWDKHFKMIADIDLSDYTGSQFNIIGEIYEPFLGVFDGNNHTISNFYYESAGQSRLGIFSVVGQEQFFPPPGEDPVDSQPVIKNLGLISPTIKGGSGAALMSSIQRGSCLNCYATDVNIVCTNSAAGLIGSITSPNSIADCFVSGNITGSDHVGGLASLLSGSVANCFAVCDIVAHDHVGGLIGHSIGTGVHNCYSNSTVIGNEDVGGLTGSSGSGKIQNCYALGTVQGNSRVGGLSGDLYECNIEKSYAACEIINVGGGLVGRKIDSSISASFWDVDVSTKTSSAGGTGKTTLQMTQQTTFYNWDFTTPIWKICEATNYPKLAWQIPTPGDLVCPDGVDMKDYATLAMQWQRNILSANIAKGQDDGIVNFSDWAAFSKAWQSSNDPQCPNWNSNCDIAPVGGDGEINEDDLTAFVSQWLLPSASNADIAPTPDGDGIVNILDFTVLANNWLNQE